LAGARSRRPPPRPRRQRALQPEQKQVEYEGKRHAQDGTGRDFRLVEVVAEAAEDELTEAAVPDEYADGDQRHGGDGGEPDAGHHAGQRERQLHAYELGQPPVPHSFGGVAHLARYLPEPGQRVADDDQQRVQDESTEDGEASDTEERREEREQRQRRNR